MSESTGVDYCCYIPNGMLASFELVKHELNRGLRQTLRLPTDVSSSDDPIRVCVASRSSVMVLVAGIETFDPKTILESFEFVGSLINQGLGGIFTIVVDEKKKFRVPCGRLPT